MGYLRYFLPLAVFGVLVLFLGKGLDLNPKEVPSPLIDKAAPSFVLPQLYDASQTFSPKEMLGQVWMLNVWASWCVSCRQEHPILNDLARRQLVPIYGLNYKDQRADAMGWLRNLGDPYTKSISDIDGRVGMDYGVYGVPETYVIDKEGVIRYKQIGPVTVDALKIKIMPLIKELQG